MMTTAYPSTETHFTIIEMGPSAWCWSRLRATEHGTLSSSLPGGRTVPVAYVLNGGRILVNGAGVCVGGADGPDREVTLEIAGIDPGGRWLIRVTG